MIVSKLLVVIIKKIPLSISETTEVVPKNKNQQSKNHLKKVVDKNDNEKKKVFCVCVYGWLKKTFDKDQSK